MNRFIVLAVTAFLLNLSPAVLAQSPCNGVWVCLTFTPTPTPTSTPTSTDTPTLVPTWTPTIAQEYVMLKAANFPDFPLRTAPTVGNAEVFNDAAEGFVKAAIPLRAPKSGNITKVFLTIGGTSDNVAADINCGLRVESAAPGNWTAPSGNLINAGAETTFVAPEVQAWTEILLDEPAVVEQDELIWIVLQPEAAETVNIAAFRGVSDAAAAYTDGECAASYTWFTSVGFWFAPGAFQPFLQLAYDDGSRPYIECKLPLIDIYSTPPEGLALPAACWLGAQMTIHENVTCLGARVLLSQVSDPVTIQLRKLIEGGETLVAEKTVDLAPEIVANWRVFWDEPVVLTPANYRLVVQYDKAVPVVARSAATPFWIGLEYFLVNDEDDNTWTSRSEHIPFFSLVLDSGNIVNEAPDGGGLPIGAALGMAYHLSEVLGDDGLPR